MLASRSWTTIAIWEMWVGLLPASMAHPPASGGRRSSRASERVTPGGDSRTPTAAAPGPGQNDCASAVKTLQRVISSGRMAAQEMVVRQRPGDRRGGRGPDDRHPHRDRHPVLPRRGEPDRDRPRPRARSVDRVALPQAGPRGGDRPRRDPSAAPRRRRPRAGGRRELRPGPRRRRADGSGSRLVARSGRGRVRRRAPPVRDSGSASAGDGRSRRSSGTCDPRSSAT